MRDVLILQPHGFYVVEDISLAISLAPPTVLLEFDEEILFNPCIVEDTSSG